MCTGRVDLSFILRALRGGADGVIIGGCWPGECHYVTDGNMHALANVHIARKILERIGVNPARVRIEWISAAEGVRFAEVMSDFTARVREMGPLGRGEGIDEAGLGLDLEAASQLVPYIRLVEREKLRVQDRSEEAVSALYASEEVNRLFDDMIAEKMAVGRILLLIRERPLSTGEISGRLGMSLSDVTRHVRSSSGRGLLRYDRARNLVELAGTA